MIYNKDNPRFVLNIGAIAQQFPDMPQQLDGGIDLWDRQEQKAVLTVHAGYANAICLETARPHGHPFSRLEAWFNGLDNESLASEGIAPTKGEMI